MPTPSSARPLRPSAAVLALGLLLLPGAAWAQGEMTTPRSLAMGGALVAAPTGASAIFLNPAGMPLIKGYSIEGFYDFRIRENGHGGHSSVVDSISSKWVSAGLYYNFQVGRPKVFERSLQREVSLKQQGHETGLALAMPLGGRVMLGTTIKYQFWKSEVDVLDGDGSARRTVDRINNVGVDVGLVVVVIQGLTIGVTGMNLVPQHSPQSPMGMGLGLAYAYKQLLLVAADTYLDFSQGKTPKVDVHGGLEVFLKGKFALRAGVYWKQPTEDTFVTTGFGWVSAKAGIDFFLAQQVDGGVETRVGFAVKVFVQ